MESYAESFGSWQGYVPSGAATTGSTLLPVLVAADATGVSVAAATDAVNGLGQPQAMRTHKFITRPGSPPRGRLR